ncbi:transcriptional regulator, SARP family [Deinococcus aerius]|uniref:Transcriptional regulator, SARP family n=1 Tax=Deinococcus aerius TaxID=200253 RepID=A0A2I9D6G9_9DEIO|nr:AAA family ATPase [Deinococcus aerius]GBF06030.1 transcriptional regulator, SARP family [Deinococcus aerius]
MSHVPLTWRLTLLGEPGLRAPDGRARRCEGKMLAVLAYLGLEGQVPRTHLAGLLWPETVEASARNNLVHLLRRMRGQLGADLVVAGDMLALAPGVTVDVRDAPGSGELLEGVAWPELPELTDWLLAQRERLNGERAGAWRAEAARLEEQGRWAQALDVVRRLRELDPTSEDALRREMRLHYLLGDVERARAVYERGAEDLRRAFGTPPLPETQALARDIGRGAALPARPAAQATPTPRVGRLPLVGREEAWARMEAAWAAGKGIVLTGEPGVGKTRLALDFLEAHGGGMRFRGCLGDGGLPYATHARTYRQVLAAYPDLELPGWVREELARILPQLGPAPAPITDEAQKTRFWQAKTEALRAAIDQGLRRMVFDDTQFMDGASIEAGAFVFAHLGWGDPGAPYRTIHCFRKGELTPHQQGVLGAMVGAGLVALVELEPLDGQAVEELVAGLNLPPGAHLASDLARFTGGNPLLLLETARSLHETGARGGLAPAAARIRRRRDRLAPVPALADRAARRPGRRSSGQRLRPRPRGAGSRGAAAGDRRRLGGTGGGADRARLGVRTRPDRRGGAGRAAGGGAPTAAPLGRADPRRAPRPARPRRPALARGRRPARGRAVVCPRRRGGARRLPVRGGRRVRPRSRRGL